MIALILTMALAPSLGRYRKLGWIMVPVFMAILAVLISGGATLDRLLEIVSDDTGRLDVYRTTAQAIADYPVLGTGAGSFVDIFPIYQPESIRAYFDQAHNDYLQNILELGIPAAICLFALVCWPIVTCLRGVSTRQRDAIYPCVAVAASVLVGLHATVDFSLQIPAVTVSYMFLLGIGVAQSRSSRASVVKKPSDLDQRLSGKPDNAPDRLTAQL
jgi:O-antigen ligase